MGDTIQLNTTGTQCIGAYVARPEGTPKGGIVVVQEIFGVNAHMRHVTDRFAAHGYVAIAPAFFDHFETGVELGYDDAGMKRGRELVGELQTSGSYDGPVSNRILAARVTLERVGAVVAMRAGAARLTSAHIDTAQLTR